jgi:quinol monooxygenase YgiN
MSPLPVLIHLPMTNPFAFIVDIHAKPEHRQQVREILANLERESVKEPGNIAYIVHQVDNDPDHFIIYEKWQDRAALDFHNEQDYLISFRNQKDQLLTKIDGKFCSEVIPR